jgi:hypothetical protein
MKAVLLLIATMTVTGKKTLEFECVPAAASSDLEQVITMTLSNGTVARFPVCPPRMTLRNTPLDPKDAIELGDMPVYPYYWPSFIPKWINVVEEDVIPDCPTNFSAILENAITDVEKRIDDSDSRTGLSVRIGEQLQKDIELRMRIDRWMNDMRYVRPPPRSLYKHVAAARRYKSHLNLSSVYRDEMCHKARRRILFHECTE